MGMVMWGTLRLKLRIQDGDMLFATASLCDDAGNELVSWPEVYVPDGGYWELGDVGIPISVEGSEDAVIGTDTPTCPYCEPRQG